MATDETQLTERLADPSQRKAAFSEMMRTYGEPVYWKIRRMVMSHDDANDVLQNVFIKAWRGIDDFQGRSKVSTWLYRIAVNESLDFIRRNRRQTAVSMEADTGVADRLASDPYFDGDRAEALLLEAIDTLPDVQKTVFQLRYYDNMKYSEISEVLHTSEGALKASFHLAAKKIRNYLDNHD